MKHIWLSLTERVFIANLLSVCQAVFYLKFTFHGCSQRYQYLKSEEIMILLTAKFSSLYEDSSCKKTKLQILKT